MGRIWRQNRSRRLELSVSRNSLPPTKHSPDAQYPVALIDGRIGAVWAKFPDSPKGGVDNTCIGVLEMLESRSTVPACDARWHDMAQDYIGVLRRQQKQRRHIIRYTYTCVRIYRHIPQIPNLTGAVSGNAPAYRCAVLSPAEGKPDQ